METKVNFFSDQMCEIEGGDLAESGEGKKKKKSRK